MENHIVIQMFNQLHDSYNLLPINDSPTINIDISPIDKSKYESNYLKPIKTICNLINDQLSDFVDTVLLHGSMTKSDFVKGWSDVDIICVIKASKIKDLHNVRDTFLLLEDELYKIDHYQHHGIQYITDKDLLFYPDVFYPHELFKYTLSLFGKTNISIKQRDDISTRKSYFDSVYSLLKRAVDTGVLYHHKYKESYLVNNFKNIQNMYQLKYFLSLISLLPSLWLNLAGVVVTKERSFKYIKLFISDENMEILYNADKIRSMWDENTNVKDNNIPVYIQNILGLDYFEKAFKLITELNDRMSLSSFKCVQNYCDILDNFCEQNKDIDIAVCGSIKQPGLSDIDLLVLDKEPYVDEQLSKYMLPLNRYGGNVLIIKTELYKYLNYIIDLSITPLKGSFDKLITLTKEEKHLSNIVEIIEWLPERICLAKHVLNHKQYDTNRLHLLIKSIKRSIVMVQELTNCKNYNTIDLTPTYQNLSDCYYLALNSYSKFEEYMFTNNYISCSISGSVNICDYYHIKDSFDVTEYLTIANANYFNILKSYLYHVSQFPNKISKVLSNKINLQVEDNKVYIRDDLKAFIKFRWNIIDNHFTYFKENNLKKGLIKWGWLL
ncbi:MAG: hypothetical protein ACW98X_19135 [Promethearchaeota archaeon]|jgi:predicted nucleotidyltransferase